MNRRLTNILCCLVALAIVLLPWRAQHAKKLISTRAQTAFAAQHYYTLLADDTLRVCDVPTRAQALALALGGPAPAEERRRLVADEQDELAYWLSSHGVQDEGFDMIAAYKAHIDRQADSLATLCQQLARINAGTKYRIEHNVRYLSTTQHPTPVNVRTDSAALYTGQMDSLRRANGHGQWLAADGAYYEGQWADGQRQGFGFAIAPGKPLQAGEWKADRFMGERMNYHSDRIYGIDISKYQHIHGKKKYPINWSQLRISHLGTLSKKTVSGVVDYPVSFAYIKSTEGVSIKNPYYAADCRAARRNGIPVGAYHFFSVKSAASAQADYFIRNTSFRSGDLPPVLDVEPTRQQIADMGGADVLFGRLRTWLRAVERHTGVKPVLYVNQTFVNRYLTQAPDIKQQYPVWIARYGEFKPDVKLLYWQLCPDGRVKGITGAVDINVFNGYRDKFEEFLRTSRIP